MQSRLITLGLFCTVLSCNLISGKKDEAKKTNNNNTGTGGSEVSIGEGLKSSNQELMGSCLAAGSTIMQMTLYANNTYMFQANQGNLTIANGVYTFGPFDNLKCTENAEPITIADCQFPAKKALKCTAADTMSAQVGCTELNFGLKSIYDACKGGGTTGTGLTGTWTGTCQGTSIVQYQLSISGSQYSWTPAASMVLVNNGTAYNLPTTGPYFAEPAQNPTQVKFNGGGVESVTTTTPPTGANVLTCTLDGTMKTMTCPVGVRVGVLETQSVGSLTPTCPSLVLTRS